MIKKVAVLMGGYSLEADISYKSGAVVVEHLSRDKYMPYPIHIRKDDWVYVNENNEEFSVDKNDFSVKINEQKHHFDVAFNAIHGTPGEDGYLQAYFSLMGIPLTGCSMYASALTFNKRDMLATLKPFGVKSAQSFYLNKGDHFLVSEIINKVGLPCFVKANKSGSSFGVYKVYDQKELIDAIDKAFLVDNQLLIEEFLQGTEVSVGVITYRGEIKVLPITEIISTNDFFDYEAKYQGKSKEITPARLSVELTKEVSELAKKVYQLLQMKGFSRSEFIIVKGVPYLLEMNTTPGLSPASILPQQALVAGISLQELFDNAIQEVL